MWSVDKIKKQIRILPFIFMALSFYACDVEEPLTLGTLTITDVTASSIHCSVSISNQMPSVCGLYFSTSKSDVEKKIADNINGIMYGVEEFSGIIEGLQPNTTYYIRAHAMNFSGRAYTEVVAVKTLTRTPESNDNIYPDIDL